MTLLVYCPHGSVPDACKGLTRPHGRGKNFEELVDAMHRERLLLPEMAQLTQKEFAQAITLLADEIGLQRLRDRFVQLNALVTRRKVTSAQHLADQLYMLSAGLRRQVPATYAFHHIWTESLNAKLGDEGEKNLEKLAEAVNVCLGDKDEILPNKAEELDGALTEYERALSTAVGAAKARMDMIMKAVPAIAERLRAAPEPQALPAPGAPQ